MRSCRPCASARSISTASRFASAELGPFPDLPGVSTGVLDARAVGFAASAAAARGRGADFAATRLGDDINLVPLLDYLVFAQLELAVRNTFTGLHVVFIAMPGADEVHLAVGEIEPLRGLVRQQSLLDLRNRKTFAGGTALVEAKIAVGVELPFMPEHADLIVAGENDSAIAVLELAEFTDELLGHAAPSFMFLAASAARTDLHGRPKNRSKPQNASAVSSIYQYRWASQMEVQVLRAQRSMQCCAAH